jgi:hypothetical protein
MFQVVSCRAQAVLNIPRADCVVRWELKTCRVVKCYLFGNVFEMNEIIRKLKDRNVGKTVPTRRYSAHRNAPRLNLSLLYAGTFHTHFANRFEEAVKHQTLYFVHVR